MGSLGIAVVNPRHSTITTGSLHLRLRVVDKILTPWGIFSG